MRQNGLSTTALLLSLFVVCSASSQALGTYGGSDLVQNTPPPADPGPPLPPSEEGVTHTCRVVLVASQSTVGDAKLVKCKIECRPGVWNGAATGSAAASNATGVQVRLGQRLAMHLTADNGTAVLAGVNWTAPSSLTFGAPPPPDDGGLAGSTGALDPDEESDWGLDIVGVPHLLLIDSVITGLPLSRVAPLLQCLGCSHLTVRNLTIADLQPPPGSAQALDRPFGASRFTGLLSAHLSGVNCTGVRGTRGFACTLLQAKQPGANIAVRASSFVDNAAVALDTLSSPPPIAQPPPMQPPQLADHPDGVAAAYSTPTAPPDASSLPSTFRRRANLDSEADGEGEVADLSGLRSKNASSVDGLNEVLKWDPDYPDRGFGALLITGNSNSGNPDSGLDAPTASVMLDSVLISGNIGSCGAGVAVMNMSGVSVAVANSTISGNKATQGDGGGMLINEGTTAAVGLVVADGSTLAFNQAALGAGGGISVTAATMTGINVTNSSVIGNEANYFGGGLYVTPSSGDLDLGFLEVNAGHMFGNTAKGPGGAISIANVANVGSLHVGGGSNISSNRASGSGGGLYISAPNGNLPDFVIDGESTLSSNIAETSGANGGALYISAGGRTVGGLFIRGASTMHSNWAEDGGAVYIDAASGSVEGIVVSERSSLRNNTANGGGDGGGGAVHISALAASRLVIAGSSSVVSNSATHGSGGAFFLTGALDTLTISDNSSLSKNYAGMAGGCICLGMEAGDQATNVSLGNGVIASSNRAGSTGGFLAVLAASSFGIIVSVTGRCNISSNTGAEGGAFYINTKTITFTVRGGSVMQFNQAAFFGGAAHLAASQSIPALEVTDASAIIGNRAGKAGGGIYASGSGLIFESLLISGSLVTDNVAGSNGGGGIYVSAGGYISSVRIEGGSKLQRNSAQTDGGAIYLLAPPASSAYISSVTLGDRSELTSNTAGNSGGALYASATAGVVRVALSGSSICRDNRASGKGGGVYIAGWSAAPENELRVSSNTTVANNTASSGGAFFITGYASVFLSGNSTFADNQADQDGGVAALLQLPTEMTIDSCSLFNNTAVRGYGGAFSVATVAAAGSSGSECVQCTLDSRTRITVTDSQLTGNRARLDGGAVRVALLETCCYSNITLAFTNTDLVGNHADGAGGAIAVLNPAARVSESVFTGLRLRNCTLKRNTAGSDAGAFTSAASHGGALLLWFQPRDVVDMTLACQLDAADTTFEANTCNGGNGGAAMLISCPAVMRRCTFHRNQATLSGGAVATLQVGRSAAVTGLTASSTVTTTDAGAAGWQQQSTPTPSRHRSLLAMPLFSDARSEPLSLRGNVLGALRPAGSQERLQRPPVCPLGDCSGSMVGSRRAARRRLAPQPPSDVVDPSCQESNWQILVYDCTFTYNTAQLEFGGALYVDASENGQALLDGGRLQGNLAAGQHGGAVFFASGGKCSGVAAISTQIISNQAALASAAAVYMLVGNLATGTLRDAELQDNKAAITGGCCVLDVRAGGTLRVQNVSAARNAAAAGDGGAFYLQVQTGGTATLLNCSLFNNTAGGSGGAARLEGRCGSQLELQNSTLSSNQAGGSGGALYVSYGSETLIQAADGSAASGSAGSLAGASLTSAAGQMPLYPCADHNATAAVSWLTLTGNSARRMGGAVFLARGSSVSMEGISMDGNEASGAGGSVAAQNCAYLALSNSSISSSYAQGPGGGLFAEGCGRVLLQWVDVVSSQAGAAGGGLFIAGAAQDFDGQAALLAASARNASRLVLPSGGFAYTTAVLHRLNVSRSHAADAPAAIGTGGCGGATDGLDSVSGAGGWAQNTRGQGGGVFVSGSAAVALSQSQLSRNNSAAFGSAFASTQHCDRVSAVTPNVSQTYPSVLEPWGAAWAFLDLAARQQCWALVLSDTVLPMTAAAHTTTSVLNATLGSGETSTNTTVQEALPIWMVDLEASALQVRCSPDVLSLLGGTADEQAASSNPRATVEEPSRDVRNTVQTLLKAVLAATNATSSASAAAPPPRGNSTAAVTAPSGSGSGNESARVGARYKSLTAALAACLDSTALTPTRVAVARGSYLGLPPTRMGLRPFGLASAQQQGGKISLQAGAYFDVEVQLFDTFNQSVTSDVAPSYINLTLVPVLPDGFAKALHGSRPWFNSTLAFMDPGVMKSLKVPVKGGVAVWHKVVARAWPGNYSLTFTFSGGESLGVKVAALEVPIELRPCAVGETLDLQFADKEGAPSWTACAACGANQYGLWVDSRPSLSSSVFDVDDYLQLMNATNKKMLESLAQCQGCPSTGACPGGAVVAPQPGYWHSAPNSTRMHSCPNPSACGSGSVGGSGGFWRSDDRGGHNDSASATEAGRTVHLIRCQQAWYASIPPGADVRVAYSKLIGTYVPVDNTTSDYEPPPMPPAPPPPPPINYKSTAARVSDVCLLWDLPQGDPNSYMQQQCAPGYTGNLCAACVPGFYIDSEFNCKPCPSVPHTVGLGILSFVSNVVLVLFTAITNFAEGFDEDPQESKGTNGSSKAGASDAQPTPKSAPDRRTKASKLELGDVVKVVVLHLQYLVIVTRLNVDYPNIILRCQFVFSTLTGAENYIVYNPSCVLPNRDNAGQAEVQLLAGILTPCAVVLVSLLVWICRYAFRHRPRVPVWTLLREAVVTTWKTLPGKLKALGSSARRAVARIRHPHRYRHRPYDRGLYGAPAGIDIDAATHAHLSLATALNLPRSANREAAGVAALFGDIPVVTLLTTGTSVANTNSTHFGREEFPDVPPSPFAQADPGLLPQTSLPTVASGAMVVELEEGELMPAASAQTATAVGRLSPVSSLSRLVRTNTSAGMRLVGVSSVKTDASSTRASGTVALVVDDEGIARRAMNTAITVLDLDADRAARLPGLPELPGIETTTSASIPQPFFAQGLSFRRPQSSRESFLTARLQHSDTWQRRAVSQLMGIRLMNLQGTLRRLGTIAVSTLEPHLNRPIERVDQKLGLQEQLGIVLMAAVFILYPSWAHAALSTFACYYIDDGQGPFADAQQATWRFGYWVRDMQAKCYDGRHLDFYVPIGVASVMVFCLAPPLTSWLFVRRMGQRLLKEDHVRKVYGFLYKRYKERFIWWETVLQLETLVLVGVEVLGRGLMPSYQALLLLAVFTAVAAVNITCAPLLSRLLVIMEFLSLATLSLTITLSLYFTVDQSLAASTETALAILVISMNACLLFFYLFVVVRRFMPESVKEVAPRATALLRRLSTARRGTPPDPSSAVGPHVSSVTAGLACLLPCWPCFRRRHTNGVGGGGDVSRSTRYSKSQVIPEEEEDAKPTAVSTPLTTTPPAAVAATATNTFFQDGPDIDDSSCNEAISECLSAAAALYAAGDEGGEPYGADPTAVGSEQRMESGRLRGGVIEQEPERYPVV